MRATNIAARDRTTQPLRDRDGGLFCAAPQHKANSAERRADRYQQLRIEHERVAYKRILIACELANWTPGRASGLLSFVKWFVDQCLRRRRPGSLPKAEALKYPGRHPDTTRAYLRFLGEVVAPSGAWEWAEVDGAVLMSGFFTSERHRQHVEERWRAGRAKDADRAARRRSAAGASAEIRRRGGVKPQALRDFPHPSTLVLKPNIAAAGRVRRPPAPPMSPDEIDAVESAWLDPPKKKKAPLQPLPPQVAEPQPPDPPTAPVVAGEPLVFALDEPDAERMLAYGRLSGAQGGELTPAQMADFEAILNRLQAAGAFDPPPEPEPPPPAAVKAPPRPVPTAAGATVHPDARRRHERTVDEVGSLLGIPLGDANEHALCRTPATRAQIEAVVPSAQTFGITEKLLARGISPVAAYHAWRYTFVEAEPPPGLNYIGRLLSQAVRTQKFFDGEASGWDCYRQYVLKKQQKIARRRARAWPR